MQNTRKKQNIITVVYLILFLLNIFFGNNSYKMSEPSKTCVEYSEALIYFILLAGWAYTIHTRLIQRGLQKYLIIMTGMLILWFMLRALKYYYSPPGTDLARYLWYLYYLPLLFFPLFAVMATCYIGQKEDYNLPKKSRLLYLVSFVLFVMVLTNDSHQLVFEFPENVPVYSDMDYTYGPIYYLIFGWFLLITIAVFFHIYHKSRFPGKGRRILGPAIPLAIGLVYHIGYITGHAGYFNDMIAAMSFFTISSFEIAIRTGLIRSNSDYIDLFKRSSIPVQIVDENLQIQYGSESSHYYEDPSMREVIEKGNLLHENVRISSSKIRGGYVVWQEDVSDLLKVREELETANEFLEDSNSVLNRSYITGVRRHRLEEQNRLYNSMQNETAGKLQKLSELISEFEQDNPETEQECLLKIGIISAYLKRRNNLIFLAEETRLFPVAELKHCLTETARMLESFGVICKVQINAKGRLSFEHIVRFYDVFQEIVEKTVIMYPSYFVSVNHDEMLSIRIAGISRLPEFSFSPNLVEEEDEGEWLLEIQIKEGEKCSGIERKNN